MNEHIENIKSKYGIEIIELDKSILGTNSYFADKDDNIIHLHLEEIELENNLQELLPFSEHLKVLELIDCNISSVKYLENFPNIEILELVGNSIQKIEGLYSLSKLRKLKLWEDLIVISDLEENEELVELDIYSDLICLKNICSIPSLKILSINQCQLSNLKDLSYKFPLLEELNAKLNFDFCNMTDIEELVNLKKLDLSNCYIEKIEGLESLSKLEILLLNHNIIKNIEGLNKLTNLKELGLRGNYIQEIEGVENLEKLEKLDLSNNDIKSYEYKFPQNLKVLDLRYNKIEKINEDLFSYDSLLLTYNRITNIPEGYLQKNKINSTIDIRLNPLKALPEIPENIYVITKVVNQDTGYFYNLRYHEDNHTRMDTPVFLRWLKALDPIVYEKNPCTLGNMDEYLN